MGLDLAAHIAKLRAAEAASPKAAIADDALIFWGEHFDKSFLHQLKSCVGSPTVYLRLEPVETLTVVKMYCKQKKVTRVISTSITLLKKLLFWDKVRAPSLEDYAGSHFTLAGMSPADPEIEIVFIYPLKQLVTKSYGKFMARRLITKLTKPDTWYVPTTFTGWELLTASNEAALFTKFLDADLVCIDIETFRENATIRCLSYTAFYTSINTSLSVVLPLDSDYSLAIMRKWNWQLKAPKIFQNGKYDNAYLARYSAPVYNYLYDTANFFHCWYSELPKDLGFLNAFFIRKAVYWKDLAETNDLHEYYRYNALDTWGTGNAFLAMVHEAPQYAIQNYLLEFPLTFPCHLSEMTGIARDMDKLELARAEQQEIVDTLSLRLDTILGTPEGQSFNVKSSPNKKALFKILGCGDLKQQDEKSIKKAMYRHPFNARVLRLVLDIIKARTLISNYLTAGKEFYRQDGTGPRYLYSLNPHGTDTSRLASKSHHFWCGDNVQKIPRGSIVKQTFKADPGFLLFEVDLAQAESRDTAYISGDAQLIENVEHSPDFHCSNASGFFGVPFEEMFDIATGKVLRKDLRQLGKPVNHGANYNMGAYVLIDTMGEEKIVMAKRLLGLPRFWTYLQVADHLLAQFHLLYPGIKGTFYEGVKEEIGRSKMLKSMAVHRSWHEEVTSENKDEWYEMYEECQHYFPAWTRYCFGNPSGSKRHLNVYIAHPPQSLNAQTLNKSFLPVFHDMAINPKHSNNFKLAAQIHDSILAQHRIGHEYLKDMVVERMQVPVTIKAYDGKIRTFCVPADASNSGAYWSELK